MQEDCDVLKPSDNVVIYGHHMNNGSMFADLEKFKDEDFWREHKTIAFNTLTEKNEYEILAVFKTVVYTDSPEAFKYYRFTDAQSPEEFDAFSLVWIKADFIRSAATADLSIVLIVPFRVSLVLISGIENLLSKRPWTL